MSKSTHLLKVNTREGILELDGTNLMNCATACEISYHGPGIAVVKLSLVAEVELEDLCQVCTEKTEVQ